MTPSRLFCLILVSLLVAFACTGESTEATTREESIETTVALHKGAKEGDMEWVRSLISSGTNINAKDEDRDTPLHMSALAGHKHEVELLVVNGANIEGN